MYLKLRNTCLLILALAGILVAGGSAMAQKPGKKKTDTPITRESAMLAKIFFKYHDMEALSQKIHGKMIIHTGGLTIDVDIESTVTASQPNKFHIASKVNFLGDEKRGSVFSDGKNIWDVDEDAKEYSLLPADSVIKDSDKFTDWLMDRVGMDMTLLFFLKAANSDDFGVPKGVEKAELDKMLDVKNYPTKEVDGTKMYLVPVPLDEKDPTKKGQVMVLYVDTKDFLIRRISLKMKIGDEKDPKDKDSMEMVMNYDAIKPGVKVTDGDLTFLPPDGTKKVEMVKPVFSRAFDK